MGCMTKKMTYGEGQAVNVHEKAADVHTEAGRANVRDLFTPAFWRSFAALSLVLSVSSFMNVSVFPFFDGCSRTHATYLSRPMRPSL